MGVCVGVCLYLCSTRGEQGRRVDKEKFKSDKLPLLDQGFRNLQC